LNHPSTNLLQVEGLSVVFDHGKPTAHRALDGVSLSIGEGEILGLVGESGSGKTVLSHSILGLLPRNGRVTSGSIRWKGRELQSLSEKELRPIRGKEIAMIFQDPQASLNPVYPVAKQLLWRLKLHRALSGRSAMAETYRLLEAVQLSDPKRVAGCYAHELSGGMAQRVMIAMALAGQPRLLIADEATSALDATIQLEIVSLLKSIQANHRMAVLFITHNLNLLRGFCSQLCLMYRGKIVEQGSAADILSQPTTEYGEKLLVASGLRSVGEHRKFTDHGVDSGKSLETITLNH
jgi:ABC-type dipeptide/oligopeptide/nickel transport system ATPase component